MGLDLHRQLGHPDVLINSDGMVDAIDPKQIMVAFEQHLPCSRPDRAYTRVHDDGLRSPYGQLGNGSVQEAG